MTTDPKTLIERFPLTAEACKINSDTSRLRFAIAVKDYANINNVGDFAFDSVESLMQAIESHLAASRPKPLTEEDVAKMRWKMGSEPRLGRPLNVVGQQFKRGQFTALDSVEAKDAVTAHNADIDRLWTALQAERAECKRLATELEARR